MAVKLTSFSNIPKLSPPSNYAVDVHWRYLENWIERESAESLLDMDPDFQRDHVWSKEQQIKYVEFCLKGGMVNNNIYWNNAEYVNRGLNSASTPLQLVDGKQRLEAVRAFLRDELKVFGSLYSEFEDKLPMDVRFRFHVNNLENRADILRWYIDLNSGGVVHSEEEINKVKLLLEKEVKEKSL